MIFEKTAHLKSSGTAQSKLYPKINMSIRHCHCKTSWVFLKIHYSALADWQEIDLCLQALNNVICITQVVCDFEKDLFGFQQKSAQASKQELPKYFLEALR